jgi:predicted metal-binding membrane protein
LDHRVLGELDFSISSEYVKLLLVFVAAWTLMTVAMMLPTSLPLILLFQRLIRQRSDRLQLLGLLIGGYIGIWVVFGALAHFADLFVHLAVDRFPWLEANAWLISAMTLGLAGLYQFTPLKYKCLEQCRSPLTFITRHWRGRHERAQSFGLGVHHGLFCVGCCWALMLLMFAVGAGNIAWMLMLGTVMAVEKNLPWGRRLSAPLGITLLAAGVVVAVTQSAVFAS